MEKEEGGVFTSPFCLYGTKCSIILNMPNNYFMTAQEAIEKIKALFSDASPVSAPVAPAAFAEYTLADGTKVMIDVLDVGGKVTMLDAGGVESPVGAGDYALADGTMISVDDTGTIVKVASPDQAPSQPNAVQQRIQEMQTQLDELKALNQSNAAQFKEQFQAQNEKMTALKDILVAALETPSAQTTETNTQSFRHTESKEDKINRFLDKVKSFK